jgi:HK97 gp10 family phage protein
MAEVGVTVDGLNDLLRRVDQLSVAAANDFREAAVMAGEPVLAAARNTVPVKSGALKGTIRLSPTTRGVRIMAGNKRVPYAAAIHFGQKRDRRDEMYRFRRAAIPANPFLFRAIDQTKDEVVNIYLREIKKIWEEL